jgi:signal transduction histidine kinase
MSIPKTISIESEAGFRVLFECATIGILVVLKYTDRARRLLQYVAAAQDERVAKHLLRIKSNVANLTGILNDFLSLDKLEQGKVDIEFEVFDVNEFIQEVAEDVRPIQKAGQKITITHNGDSMVTPDQKKLRYILTNLFYRTPSNIPRKIKTFRYTFNISIPHI